VLQYVAVCCSVLQCVAVCCSEIESPWSTIATRDFEIERLRNRISMVEKNFSSLAISCGAVCCSVLQCSVVEKYFLLRTFSPFQSCAWIPWASVTYVWHTHVLPCVAECCSVLQRVACVVVCGIVWQSVTYVWHTRDMNPSYV